MTTFVKLVIYVLLIGAAEKCFSEEDNLYKWPTIGISILVRNKAHTLPYFLGCLDNLDYPKDRLYIWITSDYNEDNSIEIIEDWASRRASDYNTVIINVNSSLDNSTEDEMTPIQWSESHFKHIIHLREEALEFARKKWADFLLMIDADAFIVESSTLKDLVQQDLTVAAPLLISDGLYSNYWCAMTEGFYYKRTEDYRPILERQNIGCFEVPMVNTAVLISLKRTKSDLLTYDPRNVQNYEGPNDDIITFAVNAKIKDIPLFICNEKLYGFVTIPLQEEDDPKKDFDQLLNVKMEAISRGTPLPMSLDLKKYVTYPKPSKYGCNEIYMINLERRTERRLLMELSFKELGMEVMTVFAVDGKKLDLDNLHKQGIGLMPNYEDPYHKRPMKAGEIGCFLSHYNIWKDIVEKQHDVALILEDDIKFVPYFRQKFELLLKEMKEMDWDLMYLGRKILLDSEEEMIGSYISRPLYSYWTLGYMLTAIGARKLINSRPLENILPVDEFLPIMFNEHPNDTWKSYFKNRDLKAYSAAPLLIHPTHYTGQPGYISDTEDSTIIEYQATSVKVEL